MRVNWEICCYPADGRHARKCVVVPLLCSFALVVLLCLWFVPSHLLLVHGGPCAQVSRPNLHWEFSVTGSSGRWPVGDCHGYPFICILPTADFSLPALLSIGTSILNIALSLFLVLLCKVRCYNIYSSSANYLNAELCFKRTCRQFLLSNYYSVQEHVLHCCSTSNHPGL